MEGSVAATTSSGDGTGHGMVSNQLAMLVPSFDPGKDDLQIYQQKVELLCATWPENRFGELATRLVLNTTGTAFQKLQQHQLEVTANDKSAVKRIIALLGGTWGQIPLERKFEAAEKALFRCQQKSDESNDSYIARSEVLWQDLLSKGVKLEELQAYIILRGSQLNPDDKKRVILDSDASAGKLEMPKVQSSIRMLGAGFFQEMVSGRKQTKFKTYDNTILFAEDGDEEDAYHTTGDDGLTEDDFLDTLAQDGDDDAAFIVEFEQAAQDVVQEDSSLACAFTAYIEARRRLSEKFRHRGFFPIGKGKGKSFGKSGKGKGFKGGFRDRRPLSQRILKSQCKKCLQFGHWKDECPNPPANSATSTAGSNGSGSSGPSSFAGAALVETPSSLPLEFLNLQEFATIDEEVPHAQEACQGFSNQCVVCFGENIGNDRKGYNDRNLNNSEPDRSDRQFARECLRKRRCEKDSIMLTSSNESSVEVSPLIVEAETFNVVASHGPNFGIMDTGATKTVMGSNLIKPFLDNLNEEVRKKVRRSNCQITFRFGNLQTLDSTQALVIPIGHLHLKIAIVPGNTPFLLSNTLLRALKAATDFHNHILISPMLDQAIPLVLSAKGLFLIDMNLLTDVARSMDGRIIRETFTLTDIPAGKFANPEGPMKVTVESKVLTGSENERDSECLKVNSVECTRSCEAARNSVFESAAVEPSVQISETSSPTFRRATICDHVSDRPPQEDSSAQHGALGGCDQVQPASTGEHEDGFRSGSSWKDFRNDVVRPPELDQVVHRTLPEQSQMGAPQDDALHRTQDRKARTGRNNRSSADGRGHEEEGQTSVYNTGTQEDVSCQDNGQEHGQSNAHQVRDHGGIGRTLGGSRHRGAEHCPVGATGDPGRNSDHAIPNAQHRECAADHREPSSELCHHARAEGGLLSESPEWHLIHAGDGDQDCHDCIQQSVSETSDRNRFNKLVRQLTMELEECARKCPDTPKSQSMLFEVFCSRNSQLTQQCVNLGNQAHRFGYDQGNLHEIDGRRNLFEALVQQRPRHLWFSPECGPWCAFSELNASKSPQAFELIQNRRRLHIVDLALGVVLLRFQIQNRNHFHWEQPSRSLMFRNPLVKEMLEKTQCAQFDMCVMGDLQDPMSGVRMKKGLQVMTTSRKMFQHLHGHTCPGNHEHQQIEGSTWFQGQSISRTKFTERYPRKFARNVARVMNHDLCSIPFVLEHCFVNLDVDNPRVHKCPRRTDPRAKASVPPAIEPAELPELKRRRIVEKGSDHSVNLTEKWKVIVDKVDHLTPRVGKKVIRDNEIINCFQELLPDKEVQFAIVCRGTDRALGPGKDVVLGEAPFRRCVFKHRTTDAIMIEESWELWEQLSQARIQRKGHPCRLNITLFARNPLEGESDIARNPSQSSEVPRTETLPTDSVPIPEEKFEPPISGDMTSSESNLPNPQVIDLQSVNHGPRFLQLSKTDQQELIRAHKNLGHPSNEKLSLLLKQQGCSSELSTGVLDLKCSVCHMQARPKHSRPGTIKESLDFNDRIAIDGLKFTNSQGQIFHIYHIIDMATNFHVAMIAPSRTVDSLIQCVIQMWLCWAGPISAISQYP